MMVVWVLIVQVALEAGVFQKIEQIDPVRFMMLSLVTKYADHTAVRLTHQAGKLVLL